MCRILKSEDNQKGVFFGEYDKERCAQMFHDMESIMEEVGFTKDVSDHLADEICQSVTYISILA